MQAVRKNRYIILAKDFETGMFDAFMARHCGIHSHRHSIQEGGVEGE